MTRSNEIVTLFDGTLMTCKELDVRFHWIDSCMPEEVMRICTINRNTPATDQVLCYNSSVDCIEINRRVRIRGMWQWFNDTGTVSHWALLPLSPREQKNESRVRQRIENLNYL